MAVCGLTSVPPDPDGGWTAVAADSELLTQVSCNYNADCTAGMNGRCVLSCLFTDCGTSCVYDECLSDSDCASDTVCECHVGGGGMNVCVKTSCHVDADCGLGERCEQDRPCWDAECSTIPVSFACTTPQDSCTPGGFANQGGCTDFGWCASKDGRFQCVR